MQKSLTTHVIYNGNICSWKDGLYIAMISTWMQRPDVFFSEAQSLCFYIPCFNEVEVGAILVSPCLSVCPSYGPSVGKIVSPLYLPQY